MLARSMRRAFDNPLMRNFAKLFAGTAAAKMLGFLAMPLIARLVTPEDFGEFSVFTAMVSVIAPLLALRYVDAIPIPKSAGCATQLLTLALLLITVNATLLLATAWLLLDVIVGIYPFMDWRFLLLVYFAAVALAVYEALNLWAVRVRNYGVIARTQVSQALAGALSKVVLSYFAIPLGLMLGQVSQNLTGIISLLKTHRAPFQKHRLKTTKKLLRKTAKQFIQYPKYRLASQVLLVVTQALPVLAVGNVYGVNEAGQWGLAFAVVSVPVMMVVSNVRKLYYGEAARIGSSFPGQLRKLTSSLMLKMVSVATVGCIILFVASEYVFVSVFGEEWRLAGKIASFFSFYVFALFFSGPFVDVLNILDKQVTFLLINTLRLIVVALVLKFSDASLLIFAQTYVVTMMGFYLLCGFGFILLLYRLELNHEKK